MKSARQGPTKGEGEYRSEHERRKRSWSDRERQWRKETRHPREIELDGTLAPEFLRRLRF